MIKYLLAVLVVAILITIAQKNLRREPRQMSKDAEIENLKYQLQQCRILYRGM